MTLLTTQEERDKWAKSKGDWIAVRFAADCNTLIGLLREARGYVEHLAWGGTSAPAADLLSRIDKEIGNG